jgi:hypothetical protein
MNRRKRLTFRDANEDDDTVEDYYKPYGEYGDGSYQAINLA